MNLSNPSELKALLAKYGFNFSKSLGQNFLIDENILEKIVSAAGVTENDCVLEIGAGAGVLSRKLAQTGANCVSVEIDKALIPILNESMAEFENFTLINDDILKVDLQALAEKYFESKSFHVVANLPYYITTPVIMKLFESGLSVNSMTLMVQKEVALRMQAGPGNKDYGALSLAVQYYADTYIAANVPPNCFMPRPKVGSAVIRLDVRDKQAFDVKDEKLMFELIRGAFNQRRKTLVNAVGNYAGLDYSKEEIAGALIKMNLSETIRGESLTLEQFAELANILKCG